MPTTGLSHLSLRVHSARLPLFLMFAATSGGCTLLVGENLSDTPSEADSGAGGQGSGGAATTGPSSGAAQSSSAQSSSAQSSTGAGGLTCPENTANCDNNFSNGCEKHTDIDNKNCGACDNECKKGTHCMIGTCQ